MIIGYDVSVFRGLFQNVPVTPGATYNAGVYIRAVSVGHGNSESWFEFQWKDIAGDTIQQFQTERVTTTQPFRLTALSGLVAPAGAVTASVRGIVRMISTPTNNNDFHLFDDFFITNLDEVDLDVAPLSGSEVKISWSTNAVGYQAEVSTDLKIDGWQPIPGIPTASGGRYSITNAADPSASFRLRKQ